jgi:hypothetical protein
VPGPPPTLAPYAAELYRSLLPLAYADEQVDWALASYAGGHGEMYQELDTLVRDSPAGPGWSSLLDVDRCPTKALPWLGQFIGVNVDTGKPDEAQRQQIRDTAGMKRGTPAAMIAAAQPTLTGNKSVFLFEREGGAYRLSVRTFIDETPNPAATLAALMTQKPAGIILDFNTMPRWTWRTLRDSFATWQLVKTHYTNWQGVRDNVPPAP